MYIITRIQMQNIKPLEYPESQSKGNPAKNTHPRARGSKALAPAMARDFQTPASMVVHEMQTPAPAMFDVLQTPAPATAHGPRTSAPVMARGLPTSVPAMAQSQSGARRLAANWVAAAFRRRPSARPSGLRPHRSHALTLHFLRAPQKTSAPKGPVQATCPDPDNPVAVRPPAW